jgi:dTDP-4-amino-4,6-dideoxygalactose transaminase
MGTLVLGHMDEMIEKRRQITDLYRERLGDVPGIHLCPPPAADIRYNYPYMPIEVDKWQFGLSRDALYEELKHYNIFARRYFYPLVNDFECFRGLQLNDPLDVARKVAGRILCLPIYCDLALEHVERICETVRFLRNN